MHPLRPKKAPRRVVERGGVVDQLADWLLKHCPLTALAVLTLIVIGSSVPLDHPVLLVIPVILADVALSWFRHARRARKSAAAGAGQSSRFGPGVTA
jgi:di/tricarboxylate transporter